MFFGLVILGVGVIALLVNLGVLTGSVWGYTWPIILIALGLGIVFGRHHHRGFWTSCRMPREDEPKK